MNLKTLYCWYIGLVTLYCCYFSMAKDAEESRVKHRCHPFKVIELFDKLNGEIKHKRIQLIEDAGFGGILKMTECNSLPGFFVNWVTENFDKENCRILLGCNRYMDVLDLDVERVYSIPRGEREIKVQKLSFEEINKIRVDIGLEATGNKKCKNISMIELKWLLDNEKDDRKWTKLAIWFIISNLLCPKSHDVASLKYGIILDDFELLDKYNWCQHVLDCMKKGIRKGAANAKADFYFLMVS